MNLWGLVVRAYSWVVRAYSGTRRILRLTRKPRVSEFNKTAKITGLGMILIGLIGFVIFILVQILRY